MPRMLLCLLLLSAQLIRAQGTVPTFEHTVGQHRYTLVGRDPALGGTNTIPVLLIPVTLSFEGGRSFDAAPIVPRLLASPVFSAYPFPEGGTTQYADAMLRATFPGNANWHTLLGKPTSKPLRVAIPARAGYVLTSKKGGGALAVVDADYLQEQIFKQIPKQAGKLVIAVTRDTTFFVDHDATICCTWGTHGVDGATGNSFVLGSYLQFAPSIVQDRDVQPLTQQLGEFVNDPHHNPTLYGYSVTGPGNAVPAWMRARKENGCGDTGIGSSYFLLEPTDINDKNQFPASPAFAARSYHLENVALLPWYVGASSGLSHAFSFPDPNALPGPAKPCPTHEKRVANNARPTPRSGNGWHNLIGYWSGHDDEGKPTPLGQISPQWDVVIVAFAAPAKGLAPGALRFEVPKETTPARFEADVRALQQRGKKVVISLGGGGVHYAMDSAAAKANFLASVANIVRKYGFNGVDIDFESPSMDLQPGDTDFRKPVTSSVVNLIAAMRQLRREFGPAFMISLVPEGPQLPAGYMTYGGQFGSYLPITYGLRDILSFVDVQDYNTPPMDGLDGEIYQAHTLGYHAALTELVLRGFPVSGDARQLFPPAPVGKVAVGFLENYDKPELASQVMQYLITGHAPPGTAYKLHQPAGYPDLKGAMLWNLDEDQENGYDFSNLLGPELHADHKPSE